MTPIAQMNRRAFLTLASTALVFSGPTFAATQVVPPGYVRVAKEFGIPPAIFFGVAYQESKMRFGNTALPWPWTLNVEGKPYRYRTRLEAERDLMRFLNAGKRSIDIGLCQVNWKYNGLRLGDPRKGLDPYWNMRVSASILREHFDATGDWFTAVGMYHNQANKERARKYATSVFSRLNNFVVRP